MYLAVGEQATSKSYSKEMFSAYGYTIITDDFIVWELEFINL